MPMRRINDEVYAADEAVLAVARPTVEWLKELAGRAGRRRARLCAHRDARDPLHEMLIALDRSTYVRPHRHHGKAESFHVVEGALTVVLFHDDGRIRETIRMGEYASGRAFFYRLAEPIYHTVLVESSIAVIHETTDGPFNRTATEYAPWAPAEEDGEAVQTYLRHLTAALESPDSSWVACSFLPEIAGSKSD